MPTKQRKTQPDPDPDFHKPNDEIDYDDMVVYYRLKHDVEMKVECVEL